MSAYLVVLVLFGYAAWQVVRRAFDRTAVPHWTTAAAAGLAALVLEGYALAGILGSDLDWTYQVVATVGFALIAPTTLAWTVVGALWLRHRARTAAPTAENVQTVAAPSAAERARALMNAPTQRMRHI